MLFRSFKSVLKEMTLMLGVGQQKPIKLYNLGNYKLPNKNVSVDLSEYYMDADGDLYSLNSYTYVTKFGRRLYPLSNNSRSGGKIINTLRSTLGTKVTVSREVIKAYIVDKKREVTLGTRGFKGTFLKENK